MATKTKVEEKVKVKDKLLGGKEIEREVETETKGLLGDKKVEKKTIREKI